MNINKKDNFGRTPLYYLLASFNDKIDTTRLQTFLLAGAKVSLPKGDIHFYYFDRRQDMVHMVPAIVCSYMYVLATTPSIDYRSDAITDDIREFVTNLLRSDYTDGRKWSFVMTGLGNFVASYNCHSNVIGIFSYFYCLVQDLCSNIGIEFQPFHYENCRTLFLMYMVHEVEILKFLISKGIDMRDTCLDGANNFMDQCINYGNFEAVEFLSSIGIRPKGTLNLRTNENSKIDPEDENNEINPEKENSEINPDDENGEISWEDENSEVNPEDVNSETDSVDENSEIGWEDENIEIDPKIKKLVRETCFKLSLKNMCRLEINKSLNVDEAVKKVPCTIGEFIRFER